MSKVLTTLFLTLMMVLVLSGLQAQAGKKYALLIGINEYQDSSLLDLRTPRNDAADLARALAVWSGVFVLSDDEAKLRTDDFPSKANIEKRVRFLADMVRPEDTVLLFFSGHGVSYGQGAREEQFLVPVDADPSNLRASSVSLAGLIKTLRSGGLENVLVMVDACRENVLTSKGIALVGLGARPDNASDRGPGDPSAAMYATRAGWYSFEDPEREGRNGVFTRFILEGLSGGADGEGPYGRMDKQISLGELASWVPEAVGEFAIRNKIRQQPVSYDFDSRINTLVLAPKADYVSRPWFPESSQEDPVPVVPSPGEVRDFTSLYLTGALGIVASKSGGQELDLGVHYRIFRLFGASAGVLLGLGEKGVVVGGSIHGVVHFTEQFGLGIGIKGLPWYLAQFTGPAVSVHINEFLVKFGWDLFGGSDTFVLDLGYSLALF